MYTEEYNRVQQRMEDFKRECLGSVSTLFTTIQLKPIEIGNMVYYICKDELGNTVPAYCYKSDYKGNEGDFKPIYDRNETHEYGWICFNDVVRILDVIRDRIMNHK